MFLITSRNCKSSSHEGSKLSRTIHGTILALGMNIPGANMEDGEDSKSESLVHCYYNIFKTFDMSECLSFFESSFASEQEKLVSSWFFFCLFVSASITLTASDPHDDFGS